MLRMLGDGGSDSDGGEFEAVTPEHDSETYEVQETTHAIEKRRHVLEDVDGELEMEDVAPSVDGELNSICNIDRGNAREFEKNLPVSFGPPLPQDLPPSSARRGTGTASAPSTSAVAPRCAGCTPARHFRRTR